MKLIEQRVLHEQPWTILKEYRYLDDLGEPRSWTFIERREGQQAVVIVPVTEKSRSLLLIRQFRIPLQREVLEFPAGLVDPGERPEETAHRELSEETGYSGRILEIGPEVCTSPGITTERVRLVRMIVGEEPAGPQRLEGSERIEVLKVAPGSELELVRRSEQEGYVIDAKVYLYLMQPAGW